MAGTDDDNSRSHRSDDEWPLFNAAVARLSEIFTGSDKTALELILYHLEQHNIRWDCYRIDIYDSSGTWTAGAVQRFLFDRLSAGAIEVDQLNNIVTRSGPAIVPIGKKGAYVVANGPRTVVTAWVVRLCWNDITGIFQASGPPPQSTSEPTAPPEASPAPSARRHSSSEPDPPQPEPEAPPAPESVEPVDQPGPERPSDPPELKPEPLPSTTQPEPPQPPEQQPQQPKSPEPGPPKMKRGEWLERYLTDEKKAELSHYKLKGACKIINQAMADDPRVNAFDNPRSIEPFLDDVFPPRSRRR